MQARPKELAVAFVAGAAVALWVGRQQRLPALENPNDSEGGSPTRGTKSVKAPSPLPPLDVEEEVFSRIQSFFGEEGFGALKGSFVVVVGLGGVGSHAASMLARSGVGALRLVDFDQVSLSSLNRHAVASLRDVGRPKSEVLKARLSEVVPWCATEAVNTMFTADAAQSLLAPCRVGRRQADNRNSNSSSDSGDGGGAGGGVGGSAGGGGGGSDAGAVGSGGWRSMVLHGRKPDYVIDAIDDVNTKAELIEYCQTNGLPVITACAAGGKADPTRLHMGLLSDASRDPLASKMRWKLKKAGVPLEGVVTVYSSENPRVKLLPLTQEQIDAGAEEFGVADGFRTRVMPVLGTSPAVMGQSMAAYVLCALAKQAFKPEPVAPMSVKARHKMAQHLVNREQKLFQNPNCIVDKDDIEFIVTELWRAKCAATGERAERVPMEITRWRAEKGDGLDNYVLLQSHLAKRLDAAHATAADATATGTAAATGGPESVEGLGEEAIKRIDEVLGGLKALGERYHLS